MPAAAGAQTFSQRGFVEGAGVLFPQEAPNDPTHARRRSAGSGGGVRQAGALDSVRRRARPASELARSGRRRLARRLSRSRRCAARGCRSGASSATLTRGRFTLDVGKQFIRWGKTDIVTPTDRFAPRDFLNVIDTEFLAVTAVRGVAQIGSDTFEAVWVPRFTPSRIPLLDQRWSGRAAGRGADSNRGRRRRRCRRAPRPAFAGRHVGDEDRVSRSRYFDGFNHLPAIRAGRRSMPRSSVVDHARCIRRFARYGADVAMPTRWFTVKAEAAYFTTPRVRRRGPTSTCSTSSSWSGRSGEWVFVGGYAGEAVTDRALVARRSRPIAA